jgi:biotin carboxyl carrier protein
MAYIATVQNQSYRVEPAANGSQERITVDGTPYAIDWRHLAPLASHPHDPTGGHFSLLIAGNTYDVFARTITPPGQKEGQTYEIYIAGQRFEVKVEDERTRLLTGLASGGTHTGEATIQAPMPGLVTAILVTTGDSVNANQPVAILEAMKMENDLLAPIAGTVKEIRASKGQTVDHGEILLIISAE